MKKKQIAFNNNLWLPIFLLLVFLYFSVSCALNGEWLMFAGFLFFTLLAGFIILIQPLVIVFSKEEIKIIYTVGVKEKIEISRIKTIYEEGNWFAGFRGWPVYVICYPQLSKKAFFMNGEIPKTRKIKRLIKNFCAEKME